MKMYVKNPTSIIIFQEEYKYYLLIYKLEAFYQMLPLKFIFRGVFKRSIEGEERKRDVFHIVILIFRA